ncbi:uncharacterized protein AAG666_023682 isoform 2-T3 [Megaptera novaeangliae]
MNHICTEINYLFETRNKKTILRRADSHLKKNPCHTHSGIWTEILIIQSHLDAQLLSILYTYPTQWNTIEKNIAAIPGCGMHLETLWRGIGDEI